jgi:hypothetical protein
MRAVADSGTVAPAALAQTVGGFTIRATNTGATASTTVTANINPTLTRASQRSTLRSPYHMAAFAQAAFLSVSRSLRLRCRDHPYSWWFRSGSASDADRRVGRTLRHGGNTGELISEKLTADLKFGSASAHSSPSALTVMVYQAMRCRVRSEDSVLQHRQTFPDGWPVQCSTQTHPPRSFSIISLRVDDC